jgi:hypothetical protein
LTYIGASLSQLDVFLIVRHRVLNHVSQKLFFAEYKERHPNHCEEDTRGTKGDLSGWDAAGVLGNV